MADKKNLPATDALKDRFKAGSIPLQSDFADLIDMAAAGASATGAASDQNGKPGLGMKLSADGKLELNATTFNFNSSVDIFTSTPVVVDSSNNKPVIDLAYGLTGSSNGLSVKASTGIVVNSYGVSVDSGIIANAAAGAKAVGLFTGMDGSVGRGMRRTTEGRLELNVDTYNFNNDAQGSMPLKVNTSTNVPVIDLHYGLEEDSSGLKVKASTGIKVDANGVSVDMAYVVPRGVIVMFSGSSAPSGWAFCDGKNGTPDLRDRFVKGANDFASSLFAGGHKTNKYYPTGTVTVNSHTLTVDQIPQHQHSISGSKTEVSGSLATFTMVKPSMLTYTTAHTENTGGGQGHSHTATFSGADYIQDNEPQFFVVAFIMKL